eukprot:m.2547 g.2547  ORF g.2547 m.2547 type:complete len:386 (+) comp2543_c0_seq1:159-1316(+)
MEVQPLAFIIFLVFLPLAAPDCINNVEYGSVPGYNCSKHVYMMGSEYNLVYWDNNEELNISYFSALLLCWKTAYRLNHFVSSAECTLDNGKVKNSTGYEGRAYVRFRNASECFKTQSFFRTQTWSQFLGQDVIMCISPKFQSLGIQSERRQEVAGTVYLGTRNMTGLDLLLQFKLPPNSNTEQNTTSGTITTPPCATALPHTSITTPSLTSSTYTSTTIPTSTTMPPTHTSTTSESSMINYTKTTSTGASVISTLDISTSISTSVFVVYASTAVLDSIKSSRDHTHVTLIFAGSCIVALGMFIISLFFLAKRIKTQRMEGQRPLEIYAANPAFRASFDEEQNENSVMESYESRLQTLCEDVRNDRMLPNSVFVTRNNHHPYDIEI